MIACAVFGGLLLFIIAIRILEQVSGNDEPPLRMLALAVDDLPSGWRESIESDADDDPAKACVPGAPKGEKARAETGLFHDRDESVAVYQTVITLGSVTEADASVGFVRGWGPCLVDAIQSGAWDDGETTFSQASFEAAQFPSIGRRSESYLFTATATRGGEPEVQYLRRVYFSVGKRASALSMLSVGSPPDNEFLEAVALRAAAKLAGKRGKELPSVPGSWGPLDSVPASEIVSTVPVSKYAPATNELPGIYKVNVPETFTQNISTFASSYLFPNKEEGDKYARQWRIIDGYTVAFDPDGLGAGVLQGKYYISIETYLFEGTSGANEAFSHMDKLFGGKAGTERPDVKRLGNRSGAYKLVQGTVGSSDVPQAYYRFLFRRGNVVTVVQVAGADSHMSIDKARDVAVIIDDRLLGNRPATEPTPIPTPKINLPPQPTAVSTTRPRPAPAATFATAAPTVRVPPFPPTRTATPAPATIYFGGISGGYCQRVGSFTYCDGPGGSWTCSQVGSYSYCDGPSGQSSTCSAVGSYIYCDSFGGRSTGGTTGSGSYTCSTVGSFTNCYGPGGASLTCTKLGSFLNCHDDRGRTYTCSTLGSFTNCY